MQLEMGEFFETINDALQATVTALGGFKKVGPKMRPELPEEQAAQWLRDCLNPSRREKLSPEHLLMLLRMARAGGYHAAMHFLAFDTGYRAVPIEPDTQEAELERDFIAAVGKLEGIQAKLQRIQRVRGAA